MTLLRILAVIAASTYFSCPVVAAELVLQPSGLQPGDEYRLFFVTSTKLTARSPVIEVYNAFVQETADAAPAVGSWGLEWKAVASTDRAAARDNTNTNNVLNDIGVPIYRVDGQLLWRNNEHLWGNPVEGGPSKNPLVAPNITELGTLYTESVAPFSYAPVWTGTNVDGTRAGGRRSSAFGSNVVAIGAPNSSLTGTQVTVEPTDDVHLELPLYAISEVITVVPEPSGLTALSLGGPFLAFRRRVHTAR